ncbi:hypothetical protein ElyMa_004306000 [Elysia marginata]|uniref:Uncharacterized protein n=1 Tax=Elysia marginata TaxID=1093978 RepID=A0AAV4H1U8_9GAST|nr:hypothetical protein ElyMa_004306000 [Elysia marginata]
MMATKESSGIFLSAPLTRKEMEMAIKCIKNGKAAALDGGNQPTSDKTCKGRLYDAQVETQRLSSVPSMYKAPETTYHIVLNCPVTKIEGGHETVHNADEDLVAWINKLNPGGVAI